MKTKIAALFSMIVLGILTSSCKPEEVEDNIETFATTEVSYDLGYALTPDLLGFNVTTIPAGFNCTNLNAESDPTLPQSQETITVDFEDDIDKDDIGEIELESIVLSLVDPKDDRLKVVDDFNFMDSLELFLIDGGLVSLGKLDNIQNLDATVINLENIPTADQLNFKDFIGRNQLTIAAKINVNRICKLPITAKATLNFIVRPCISLFDSTADKECKTN